MLNLLDALCRRMPTATINTKNSTTSAMLMIEMIVAAFAMPSPPMAPPDARIRFFALDARIMATTDRTTGQTTNDRIEQTSAPVAFPSVGAGAYCGAGGRGEYCASGGASGCGCGVAPVGTEDGARRAPIGDRHLGQNSASSLTTALQFPHRAMGGVLPPCA